MGTTSLLSNTYLVSKNSIEGVERIELNVMLEELQSSPILQIAIDSYEVGTSNMKIRYLALGSDILGKRYFIDGTSINLEPIFEILPNRVLMGHGMSYELHYLFCNSVGCYNVRDTMYTEMAINEEMRKGEEPYSLPYVARKRLKDVELMIDTPDYNILSIEVIRHLIDRVIYLERIIASQGVDVVKIGIKSDVQRINNNLPFVVYCRAKGIDISKYKVVR